MCKRIILLIAMQTLLSACSSVDSMQPFDQQQAATLLTQNRATHPAQQMIQLSLPHQWKKVDMSLGTIGTPIMLIPNDASATHWQQSIRTKVLAFAEDRHATPYKLWQNDIAKQKQYCRQVNSRILSESATQIIYQVDIANCYQERNQIQYGKIMRGSDAIYAVYYSAISGAVDNAQINQYAKRIQNAQLVRNSRY